MKKHLDFIKATSPRGQLMHRASSIKLAFADEPGFESLGTNRIKLRRETKHSQCRRRPYLSFLRCLLFSPARCSPPLLIYARWTERTLFSARTGAVNTSWTQLGAWTHRPFCPVIMALKPCPAHTVIIAHGQGMDSSKIIWCLWGWGEVGSRGEAGLDLTPSLRGFTSRLGGWGHPLFPVAILASHIKNIPDNSELHV